MTNITPQQSRKAQRLLKIMEGGNNTITEFLLEIEDRMDELTQFRDEIAKLKDIIGKEIPQDAQIEKISMKLATKLATLEKGDKGDSPSKEELVSIIQPLIPAPLKYILTEKDKKEITSSIKVPIVEKIIEKTEIIHEQPILKSEIIEKIVKESSETGETIVNKINILEIEPEKQIDFVHIKNWKKLIKDELQIKNNAIMAGTAGRDLFKDIDLSSQLNGVTKTFNIPATWNIISVFASSSPYALRKTIDYTYTAKTITFTNSINADSTLASGQTVILTVVTG